uniref:Protein prenyltransferase alpha subunit repeat-containing protein 1 n=1 Tax=Heliothis virescens TaxID=7102 RepID=A0A2A4JMZ2_HELVI
MDDHSNGLAEKIIKELNHVLAKPGLTEFDIVPLESNKNKSPVLFVETSVGLESWCVKHVYLYCYNELIEDFLTNPKRRLSRVSNLNFKRIAYLLNTTILLNPDVSTLWNKRREMMEKNFLEWVSELQFSRLVISRKPKCNEAFAYRRWILKDILKEEVVQPFQLIDAIISEEIDVCNMAADKCQNNYHCWDHRRWLHNTCREMQYDFNSTFFCFNEYKFIKDWTSKHVSDHSCFHYRQFCVKKLYEVDERWMVFEKMLEVDLRENLQKIVEAHLPNDPNVKPNKTCKKTIEDDDLIALVLGHCPGNCICSDVTYTCQKLELLFYELVSNDELLKYYKYHETLWYHRRFIVHEILETMYEYLGLERTNGQLVKKTLSAETMERRNNCVHFEVAELKEHHSKVEKLEIDWVYNCPLFKVLVKHEKELIKDRRKDSDKYAGRHEDYLKYVEGLDMHIK